MPLLRHCIEVNANVEAALRLCLDVEQWPQHFPPCQATKILRQTPRYQLFEITALANGQPMTWQSEREIDLENKVIHFRQVKPSYLLKKMQGTWRFDKLQFGVLISLEHQFEVKEDVKGIVSDVNTVSDAENYMKKTIHHNSLVELESFKTILEKTIKHHALEHVFQVKHVLPLPLEKTFSHLQDVQQWPKLLPHCSTLEVLYNDGIYQEFIMTVEAGKQIEKIRSIRQCIYPRRIDYFQPKPPPVLTKHHGSWLFSPCEIGTEVISQHTVQLDLIGTYKQWGDVNPIEALSRVEKAINHNSLTTLETIAQQVQNRSAL